MNETCTKCGRKIWGARAMRTGLGETCRRRVYRAAHILSQAGHPVADKAADLLFDGGLVRLSSHSGKVWRAVSSDGSVTYLTTPDNCNCKQGQQRNPRLCYHRVAVQVLAA